MSVVDQRVGLAAGRVRRLLVRVLLVLGGVCVATVLGWLLSAGSASAAPLPGVPRVPSAVSAAVDHVSTSDLVAIVRPVLPTASLDGVTKQVHVAVGGVGDRVPPTVPVTVPEPPAPTTTGHAASHVTPAAHPVRPVHPVHRHAAPPAHHRHTTGTAPVQRPGAHHTVPTPAHRGHVPPLPPVSSSDSGAHGGGGVAGGAGGAPVPFQHVLGTGRHLAGTPSTPRPAVAPGQQPGTSPD